MKRSITSNHDISPVGTFKDAAAATTRAWRQRYGYRVPVPPLSHALSITDGDTWTVLDAEAGKVVAVVRDGAAVLAEDLDEEE